MDPTTDLIFKVVVLGSTGVGKSSVLSRYTENKFDDSFCSTIGVDLKIKTVRIHNKVVKLQIWDTAGQERFQSITTSYYRGASAVLCVYDITCNQSFESLNSLLSELYSFNNCQPILYLLANKCDISERREVTEQTGIYYAKKLNAGFFECSAKTNLNVHLTFQTIAEDLYYKSGTHDLESRQSLVQYKKSRKCCST